jgi:hypothetical protein
VELPSRTDPNADAKIGVRAANADPALVNRLEVEDLGR